MTLAETEQLREKQQTEIDISKTIESRRSFGQFATPAQLANEIAVTTIPYLHKKSLDILEPSTGTGSFVSAFLRHAGERVTRIAAIELDPDLFTAGTRLWSSFPVDYRNVDFTTAEPNALFDLVVANPPYVRHHVLEAERKRQLQRAVFSETGIWISGLAGLYCYFLLLSLKWMMQGALGVWLIPSEWMSVNYGEAIRSFFIKSVRLLKVHKFDASDVRFSDALVSSSVIWFRKDSPGGSADFMRGISLQTPDFSKTIPVAHLGSKGKWPPPVASGASSANAQLKDFFTIRRGIATGDNTFLCCPKPKRMSAISPPNISSRFF